MKNYLRLIFENERLVYNSKNKFIQKYSFLFWKALPIVIFSLILFNLTKKDSPDVFLAILLIGLFASNYSDSLKTLTRSLPLDSKKIKYWNMLFYSVELLYMLPFVTIIYFGKIWLKDGRFIDDIQVGMFLENYIVGISTSITLYLGMKFYMELEPYNFIKISSLKSSAYILTAGLCIYGMHFVNLWLIGLF